MMKAPTSCALSARARRVSALCGALVLSGAAFAVPARAQERGGAGCCEVSPRAGIAVPVKALNGIAEPGIAAGVDVSYWLLPHLALRAEGALDRLPGEALSSGRVVPDLRVWHYDVGVEVSLLPSHQPWRLDANVGVGAATFDSDAFVPASPTGADFTHTYAAANGGVELGYVVSTGVTIFADGRAYYAAMKKDDTATFASLDPAHILPFSAGWTLPVSVGLRAHI